MAAAVLGQGMELPTSLRSELETLAGSASWDDQMNDEFARVVSADRQLRAFSELFPQLKAPDADSPELLKETVGNSLILLGAPAE